MFHFIRFLVKNDHKLMTIKAYIYTAYYHYIIFHTPMTEVEKKMGIRGEESEYEVSLDTYRYAKKVFYVTDRIASKTPWESLCYVRAMTARKLMMDKGIPVTIYMGVKYENDKMVAHAWTRCGHFFVTGGNGEGYAMVAKFKSM